MLRFQFPFKFFLDPFCNPRIAKITRVPFLVIIALYARLNLAISRTPHANNAFICIPEFWDLYVTDLDLTAFCQPADDQIGRARCMSVCLISCRIRHSGRSASYKSQALVDIPLLRSHQVASGLRLMLILASLGWRQILLLLTQPKTPNS